MHRPGLWLTLALVVAAAVRLLYLWTLGPFDAPSDASHYHELARNLADGRGFVSQFPQFEVHHTAFRPPAFPAVLGVAYWIAWPSVLLGKVVNVLLGLVVVALAFVTARRIAGDGTSNDTGGGTGDRAGVAAAWLVALYPPLIANDANLLTETLSLVLILGVVLTLADRRWAVAGGLVGLLVLSRPSAQFVLIVLAGWAVISLGPRRAAGFVVVALLVVAPWIVRNDVQVGTTSLVTSNGFNLAAVYSPEAQESRTFVDPIFDERFEETRLLQFDEAEWERELRGRGLGGIRSDPGYIGYNVGRNLIATLELWPSLNDNAERADGRLMTLRLVTLPVFYLVTVAGVVGLWRRRSDTTVLLLALVAGSFTLISLFLVAPPRLRAPLDLACCIGTAALVADLRRARLSARPHRTPRPSAGGRSPTHSR